MPAASSSSDRSDAASPDGPPDASKSTPEQADRELSSAYRRGLARTRAAARKVLNRRFRVLRLVRQAYAKLTEEEPSVRKVKDDLLTLIRLSRAWARKEYRDISTRSVLYVLGAVIYFLTPVDVIPDFIPIIGFVDDIAVVSAVVRALHEDLEAFRAWEEEQDEPSRGDPEHGGSDRPPDVPGAGKRQLSPFS